MSSISDKLKAAYEAKGLSYHELAKLCNVPRATIQRYVSGTTDRIDIDKLQEICRVLEVDTAEVIGWKKGSPNAELDERFGTILKKERLRLHWTIERMAKELDVSPSMLKLYENGDVIPKFSAAVIWAIQLGIPISAYDSELKKDDRVLSQSNDLDLKIVRLLSSLSDSSRQMALAYIQGLKDIEGKQASSFSGQSSTHPTVP